MRCKICRFWRDRRYLISEKEQFEKLAREGVSLRKLEIYFQALHFTVKKDAISSHIKNCMNIQVSQQRGIEKSIKKHGIRGIGQRVKDFFVKPVLPKTSECQHIATEKRYNWSSEKIDEYCSQCGKFLGSYSIEEAKQQNRRKNPILLESLRRH